MTEGLPYVIRLIDGEVRIPFPNPPIITCGLCLAKRGGTWKTHERVRLVRAHFRNAHAVEGVSPRFTFFCVTCMFEGDTLHKVGRHKCGDTPRPLVADRQSPSNQDDCAEGVAESWIRGSRLILCYPGQATRCPLRDCANQFVTGDTMCGAMNAMHRHLDMDHGMLLEKFWRCTICDLEEGGHKMHHHYKKCRSSLPPPPRDASPEQTASLGPSPSTASAIPSPLSSPRLPPLSIEESVCVSAAETSLVPSPVPIGVHLAEAEAEVAPNSSLVTAVVSHEQEEVVSTPLVSPTFPPQRQQNMDQGITFSHPVSSETSPSVYLSQGEGSQDFLNLWIRAFKDCRLVEDLDSTLHRCCADWLEKASARVKEHLETASSRIPSGGRRCRNQSRQQQKVRRLVRFDSDRASRIQKLFSVYPRRAVRQVLGEQSPRYSGTVEDAGRFLQRTYSRLPPTSQQCQQSRALYDQCAWSYPSEDQFTFLDRPPSKEEIELKLRRATNTSPGKDGLEYRHLRALDPKGTLLEEIYNVVWRIGMPGVWRTSRTVPIFKKGDTGDYSNFRPISLLPTMYKIFSGILSQRLCSVAADLEWLSSEQKGFLPGVHGIQEHTQLLQSAIEEAKSSRGDLVVSWLDLSNAFGSIPHAYLTELFGSLPVPQRLRSLLMDIYSDNIMEFVVGKESISIAPTAGVRQGDALSTTVFNLASEPLVRAAKAATNPGFSLFGNLLKTTAYADDIAVISSSVDGLQVTLDDVSTAAETLGLSFNANKCACLSIFKGKPASDVLLVSETPIRCLGPADCEVYLGTPIGSKLMFRPANQLIPHLDKVADSLLAPWQKLEVFRSHLLPSLSHHLASGRVHKDALNKLDTECRKFLGHVAGVPSRATVPFFYADRKVGGLGTFRLGDDADIWTIARATQLLTSKDPMVRSIFRSQLDETVRRGLSNNVPSAIPRSDFLSGVTDGGMYRVRYGTNRVTNLWQLARRAARRLRVRIDVSGEFNIRIIADDVSSLPVKAVRGLRTVVRQRWTERLLAAPIQGRVATGLKLDSSKDTARLVSCRTELRIADWKYLHCARLDLLPLRGYSWSQYDDKSCRRCGQDVENTFHVTNHCQNGLLLATKRHDSVLALFENLLTRKGFSTKINRAPPGQRLRPDLETTLCGNRVMVDVAVSFDTPECLHSAHTRKVDKYMTLGNILPLVVGSLGSWYPRNEEIRTFLGIDSRSWSIFKRKARLAAVNGSIAMIKEHLKPNAITEPDDDRESGRSNDSEESGSEQV